MAQYDITYGSKMVWNKRSVNGLIISGNGVYEEFLGIKINEEYIEEEYYKVSKVAEATQVVIDAEYLNTLLEGEYNFTIVWEDGEANTVITIQNEEVPKIEKANVKDSESVDTGDNKNMYMWINVFLFSISGLIIIVVCRKKFLNNK